MTAVFRPEARAQAVTASFNNYAPVLGGTTQDHQWSGFSDATRPPGVSAGVSGSAAQWLGGLPSSNDGTSAARFGGDANFGTDTTDFLTPSSGGGIYAFFSQTHFTITNPTPLLDLKSITLQIYMAEGLTGAFGGTAAQLAVAPILALQTTAGNQQLNPTFSLLGSSTPAVVNGSSTHIDLLTYQWDLSSITDPVEDYTFEWQTSYHSVTFGADVTESNAANNASVLAIPEPSSYAFLALGVTLLGWWNRKRIKSALKPSC